MQPEEFRDALSYWSSGVTIIASRQAERVVATTVSAFMSLSLEPPLVLFALGANATILPFLQPGEACGISLLAERQRRLATIHADPYPVGPDPFAGTVPLVEDALVGLRCTVAETHGGGDHTVIIAAVDGARIAGGEDPLIRFQRRYHGLR
jgi:3-hydroxy-9,10-secoandrosta-1,3,5(10)-triene-9,17-dione monooxygenase reductase component